MATIQLESPGVPSRIVNGVMKPALLMSFAYYFNLTSFLRWPLLAFRNNEKFRHKAFSKLWAAVGGLMSKDVHGDIEARLKSANGLVLDLGPGTGEMLSRMGTERITKIYGAEPAVDMHATLRANVAKISGLDGKYEVLACGAEPESLVPALDKAGLISSSSASDGVFDTILCIRVLCGVPRQQETIEGLYRLLKPGGRMIIYEHVVSPWPAKGSSVLGYILQKVWYLAGWNLMMGGCEINRDTVSALTKAGAAQGGWKKVDLKYWDAWNAAPWIVGELVKA